MQFVKRPNMLIWSEKPILEILATAGDLNSCALPWSLHCCSLILSAAAFLRTCSKICCPAKIANKQSLQRSPASWVCKHTNRCAAAGGRWAPGGLHSPAFGTWAWAGQALSAGALATQAPEGPLWAIFGVSVLDKFVTDSRIFWPLRETSEKHEPFCVYYCPHLFNILEDLSY